MEIHEGKDCDNPDNYSLVSLLFPRDKVFFLLNGMKRKMNGSVVTSSQV